MVGNQHCEPAASDPRKVLGCSRCLTLCLLAAAALPECMSADDAVNDRWCRRGLRNNAACCHASCSVCAGVGCTGICCGGYIYKQDRKCRDANDVTCLIPEGQDAPPVVIKEQSYSAALQQDGWCRLGKRNKHLCCDKSCSQCSGPHCSGACCGGYLARQGRFCKDSDESSCLIPKEVSKAPPPNMDEPASASASVTKGPLEKVAASAPAKVMEEPAVKDLWCRKGKRNGNVCCSASCAICGGTGCVGACCGGYISRQGFCWSIDEVSCLIPPSNSEPGDEAALPVLSNPPAAPVPAAPVPAAPVPPAPGSASADTSPAQASGGAG